jgi:hypothetical protein
MPPRLGNRPSHDPTGGDMMAAFERCVAPDPMPGRFKRLRQSRDRFAIDARAGP